jgi:hypothetical protein
LLDCGRVNVGFTHVLCPGKICICDEIGRDERRASASTF